jgi:hypothetical protein
MLLESQRLYGMMHLMVGLVVHAFCFMLDFGIVQKDPRQLDFLRAVFILTLVSAKL